VNRQKEVVAIGKLVNKKKKQKIDEIISTNGKLIGEH